MPKPRAGATLGQLRIIAEAANESIEELLDAARYSERGVGKERTAMRTAIAHLYQAEDALLEVFGQPEENEDDDNPDDEELDDDEQDEEP